MTGQPLPTDKQHVWAALKGSGLADGVESYHDYNQKAAMGLAYAQMDICQDDNFPFSSELVLQAHETAFSEVNKESGKFRHQVVCYGGYTGSEPHRVRSEMDLLESQSHFLFDNAQTPTQQLEAMAYTHAKFIRNHPFKDGNGRIGRAFLLAHMREGFEMPMDLIAEHMAENKPEYIKALNDSFNSNDLTPIMGYLSDGIAQVEPAIGKIPVPEQNPSPFNLSPDMTVPFGETRSLAEDLLFSKNPIFFDEFAERANDSDMVIPEGNLPTPFPPEVKGSENDVDTPNLRNLPSSDGYAMN